jgi:hypothetical protein
MRAGRPKIVFYEPKAPEYPVGITVPASPARIGAQALIHGLMIQLARRHDLTAVTLVDGEFGADECRRAMEAYCREMVMVPGLYGKEGLTKRLLQLRTLASTRNFHRLLFTLPDGSSPWTGSCTRGASTSSTWSSRFLTTATCGRLQRARCFRPSS